MERYLVGGGVVFNYLRMRFNKHSDWDNFKRRDSVEGN